MAGMFTGGAAMPMMAPTARMAPVCGAGMPIISRMGATIAPAESTAAVEEPVIMPGNMMMSISRISMTAGTLWKRETMTAFRASSAPDFWITVIKIMAMEMMSTVSI